MEQLNTIDFLPTALVISLNVSILPTPLGPMPIELKPCSNAAMTFLCFAIDISLILLLVSICVSAAKRILSIEKCKKKKKRIKNVSRESSLDLKQRKTEEEKTDSVADKNARNLSVCVPLTVCMYYVVCMCASVICVCALCRGVSL